MPNFDLFKSKILEVYKKTLPNRDANDYEVYLDPDKTDSFITFTFYLSEENEVDLLIKAVRNTLLEWPRLSPLSDSNQFVYEVQKRHIQSHDYWDVLFWLADKYAFIENSQP